MTRFTSKQRLFVLAACTLGHASSGLRLPTDPLRQNLSRIQKVTSAPISLVVPCVSSDLSFLPVVLASIANQTVYPQETILVMNLEELMFDGVPLLDLSPHIESAGLTPAELEELDIINSQLGEMSTETAPRVQESTSSSAAASSSTEEQFSLDQSIRSEVILRKKELELKASLNLPFQGTEGYSVPNWYATKKSMKVLENQPAHEDEFYNYVRPVKFGETNYSSFWTTYEALDYILSTLPEMRRSIYTIPNLKIYLRAGLHYAGSNRMFGANKTTDDTKIVSFFDCDDYMHPDRINFINQVFENNPDLDGLIHKFKLIRIPHWRNQAPDWLAPQTLPNSMLPNQTFDYTSEEIKAAVNRLDLAGHPEPDHDGGPLWYFPHNLGLGRLKDGALAHNGWLSVKKSALRDVPYPEDLRVGQDSVYNFRLIKSGKNFNYYPVALGAYIKIA